LTDLLNHYAIRSRARGPSATAVVLGEERIDYATLVDDARRLAHELRLRGVSEGDRVALMVPKSPAAIIGMHAILEAGGAYVPIDLQSPARRVAMVLDAAEPAAALATTPARRLLSELGRDDMPVVMVDDDTWREHPAQALPCSRTPDDIAHILFTSGSTGVPKGVQITHAMASAFIEWAVGHFGTKSGERISGHPPLHFDLSTFDIYATLCAGAELHIVPPGANLHPRALASFIRESELTQWFSVPSTLAFMSSGDVIEQDDFRSLRRVLFCGEAMPAPVLLHWMRRVPRARYTNLYGPTEATIASSYHDFDEPPADDKAAVPIGVPCAGEELLVLDEEMQSCRPEEIGELYIGGVGLSPGYWRDPEKTAAAFIEDPRGGGRRLYRTGDLGWRGHDGLFYFAGRADAQIKHRGYRIELGEIEAALNVLGDVRECAVVAVATGGFEGTAICCAFAPARPNLQPPELRSALAASLPTYMLPMRWMSLDALPKNQNGKIDRRAIREGFELETAIAS
jgi:amino acid adenylation domain-containing protein